MPEPGSAQKLATVKRLDVVAATSDLVTSSTFTPSRPARSRLMFTSTVGKSSVCAICTSRRNGICFMRSRILSA